MTSPFTLLLPVELVQEEEIGKSVIAQCPAFSSVLECFLLVTGVGGKRRGWVNGYEDAQCCQHALTLLCFSCCCLVGGVLPSKAALHLLHSDNLLREAE